jgi:hypothetical protein
MNGTLDREIEKQLCLLIAAELDTPGSIQCVPDLMGEGELSAVVPRIAIKAESQETPEMKAVQVYTVNVEASAIVRANDPESTGQLSRMDAAIDAIFNACDLAALLSTSTVQVFGSVPGGRTQGREAETMTNVRALMVPARLR